MEIMTADSQRLYSYPIQKHASNGKQSALKPASVTSSSRLYPTCASYTAECGPL